MKFVIANWKMNFAISQEFDQFFRAMSSELRKIENTQFKQVKIIFAPSFVWLDYLKKFFQKKENKLNSFNFELSAQNCFWEDRGSFTGEISPLVIKNIGCQYVILGHSERRIYLGETSEMINKKILKTFSVGLQPILCISVEERNLFKSNKEIYLQLKKILQGINKDDLKKIIFVYEPTWAISSFGGDTCTVEKAEQGILLTMQSISKIYPEIDIKKLKFLYGGNVDKQNADAFLKNLNINGVLVGKASLNPQELAKIIQTAIKYKL